MARFLLLAVSVICLSLYCANAETVESYRAKLFSAYNAKRKANGLNTVSESSALNSLAQAWAVKIAKAGRLRTSTETNNGKFVWELVFKQYGSQITKASALINSWSTGDTGPTMVRPELTIMGFGVAYSNGAYSMVGMWQ